MQQQDNLANSKWSQADLSTDQVLSFMQTEQQLQSQDIQHQFLNDFDRIKSDLDIPDPVPASMKESVSAKNLRLSENQVQSHEGFNEYMKMDDHETDYHNPDLELDKGDQMEMSLAGNLDNLTDNPDQLHNIGLIGKNITKEGQKELARETANVITQHKDTIPELSNKSKKEAQNLIIQKIQQNDKQWLSESMDTIYKNNPDTHDSIQKIQDALVLARKDPENHEVVEHGQVKLAKYMSNQIRTETTQTFLSTVAESLSSQIEGINTGEKARIDTDSMELDEEGNYSCEFTYGNSPTTYQLQIPAD